MITVKAILISHILFPPMQENFILTILVQQEASAPVFGNDVPITSQPLWKGWEAPHIHRLSGQNSGKSILYTQWLQRCLGINLIYSL